ncbi:MAG: hypothetical protein JWP89_4767, partial [Schlesneria sp.]|nr:hypothetical protein [Schlesneria sp.]
MFGDMGDTIGLSCGISKAEAMRCPGRWKQPWSF